MSIYSKPFKLQQAYVSQKTDYNKFGDYNFRNAEQMLNELNPLFNELNLKMVFKEEYLQDYIKRIGTLIDVETGETYSTESVILVDREAKEMQLQNWNSLTKEEKEIFKPVFTERKKNLGIK